MRPDAPAGRHRVVAQRAIKIGRFLRRHPRHRYEERHRGKEQHAAPQQAVPKVARKRKAVALV